MSLRKRLLLIVGIPLCVIWLLTALWLLGQLQLQVKHTLDKRLAASARMVAGLMTQLPEEQWQQQVKSTLSIPPHKGVACQISSPGGQILLRTHGKLEELFTDTTPGFHTRHQSGESWRIYTYEKNGLTITVADHSAERRQLQHGIVFAVFIPFILALIGSLVLGWWGIHHALRPLEKLRDELANRNHDSLTPISRNGAPLELATVITTINDLLQRMDAAIQREQRFTSNAAHELRTPLTAIKTHLQVAERQLPEKSNAVKESLTQANIGVERLKQTLEQLLLLARIDSGEHWPRQVECSLDAVLKAVLIDIGNNPRVIIERPLPEIKLALPKELAVTALRNLLTNALQYSERHYDVNITFTRHYAHLTIYVCDGGKLNQIAKIPPLQRFVRSGQGTGSGLGLSVAVAITQRFGGDLRFITNRYGGLCALLMLPEVES